MTPAELCRQAAEKIHDESRELPMSTILFIEGRRQDAMRAYPVAYAEWSAQWMAQRIAEEWTRSARTLALLLLGEILEDET